MEKEWLNKNLEPAPIEETEYGKLFLESIKEYKEERKVLLEPIHIEIENKSEGTLKILYEIAKQPLNVLKLLYFIVKIIILFKGKIMTKDKLTTIIGAIVGAILVIANIAFGFDIPDGWETAVIGILVAIVGLIWKPKE